MPLGNAQITIVDLNDAILSGTAPEHPVVGTLWIDTSIDPNKLYSWNGFNWIEQTLSIAALDPEFDQAVQDLKDFAKNAVDDGKLSAGEKLNIKLLLVEMTGSTMSGSTLPTLTEIDSTIKGGQVYMARAEALASGIPSDDSDFTNFETAYTDLKTYLESLSPKPWEGGDTTINPASWASAWDEYYGTLTKLQVTTSQYLANSVKPGKDYNGVTLSEDSGVVVTRGDNLFKTTLNATQGLAIEKNNSGTWAKVFYTNTDGKMYATSLVIDSTSTLAGTSASVVVSNAAAGKAGIDDLSSDLKITPSEKATLSREWEAIKAEYTQLSAQATSYGVSSTTYVTAYNNLDGVTPKIAAEILTSMVTTYTYASTTTRDAFKTKTNTYYAEAEKLRKAISDKVNNKIDTLQVGGRNLLKNTGMITDTSSFSMSAGVTRDDTFKNKGIVTQKYVVTGLTADGWRAANPTLVPANAGDVVSASAEVYIPTGHGIDVGKPVLELQFYDSTGARLAAYSNSVTGYADLTKVDVWQRLYLQAYTAPANTVKMNARVWIQRNGSLWASKLKLETGRVVTDYTPAPEDIEESVATIKTNVDDMLSDMKISVLEKNQLSRDWEAIKAEYTQLSTQASAFSVISTDYTTAYNNLDGVAPKIQNEILNSMSTTYVFSSTTNRDAFKTKITTYYNEAEKLRKAISDAINTVASGANTTANNTKTQLQSDLGENKWLFKRYNITTSNGTSPTYDTIRNLTPYDRYLISDAATLVSGLADNYVGHLKTAVYVSSAKNVTYNFYHDDGARIYVNGISVYSGTNYTQNVLTTLSLKAGWNTVEYLWAEQAGGDGIYSISAPLNTLVERMSAALSSDEGKILNTESSISDMMSDLKVTPLEKNQLSRDWESIKAEYAQLSAQATALGISSTAYTTAYNNMDAVTPKIASEILANMTTTYTFSSTTNRDAFKTKLTTYFTESQKIRKAVSDGINGRIDNLEIGGTNLLNNSSAEIDSDGNGTPDGWGLFQQSSGLARDVGRLSGYSIMAISNGNPSAAMYSPSLNIKGGETYTVSLWMKRSTDGDLANLLKFQNAAGTQSNPVTATSATATANVWTYQEQTFVAPSDAVSMFLTPRMNTSTNGTIYWVDDIKVEKGSKATDYSPSPSDVDYAINSVKANVDDMLSDLKISILEKKQLSRDWESIKAEYLQLSTQATALSVPSTAYTNAFNALDGSAPKIDTDILANMSTTYTFSSTANKDTFNTKIKTYFTESQSLRKAITDKVNQSASDANDKFNNLQIGGRNLALNTGLLKDKGSWSGISTGWDRDASTTFNGTIAWKFAWSTSITEGFPGVFTNYLDVIDLIGEQMTFSVYVFVPIGTTLTDQPYIEIDTYSDVNQNGSNPAIQQIKIPKVGNGKWTRYSTSVTIPATNSYGNVQRIRAALRFTNSAGTATDIFWGAAPKLEKGSKPTDYTAAPEDIDALIGQAQQDATNAKNSIADMSNDNKATPLEKTQLKKEWAIITAEKPQYESLATTYAVTTEKTNYVNAYDALNTAITPIIANLTTTSDIVGSTFRNTFDDYYDKKAQLIKKINELSRSIGTAAQTTANTANTTANTASDKLMLGADATNYNPNPSFEGKKSTGYTATTAFASTDAGVPANSPKPYVGRQSSRDNYINDYFSVKVGEKFIVEGWMASADSTQSFGFGLNLLDFTGTNNWIVRNHKTKGDGSWQYFKETYTVPTGFLKARFFSQINASSSFGNWYFTDIRITKVLVDEVIDSSTAWNTAKDNVNDMLSDLKVTALEKNTLSRDWEAIKAEYSQLYAQATSSSVLVDATAYQTAYNNLDAVTPKIATEVLANMSTTYTFTSAANRDAFKTKLTTYFSEAEKLRKAIADKVNATASTASDKINNLEIGGTNLLDNTTFIKGLTGWKAWGSSTIGSYAAMGISKQLGIRAYSSAATTGSIGLETPTFAIQANKVYTASFLIRSALNFPTDLDYIYLRQGQTTTIKKLDSFVKNSFPVYDSSDNISRRVYFQFSHTADLADANLLIGFMGTNIADQGFVLREVQVELGAKPTSWSPSPLEVSGYVNDTVNNLQVGGTNILKQTGYYNGTYNTSGNVGTSVTTSVALVDETTAPTGKALTITRTDTTTNSGGRYWTVASTDVVIGKKYTWSVWAKGSGTWTIGPERGGQQSIALTDTWTKYTYTFTASTSNYYQFTFYRITGQTGGSITFHSLKLEEGDKATGWTPNQSDTDSLITNAQTAANTAQSTANQASYLNNPIKIRYIRDWSNGSTANTNNHWVEIQAVSGTVNRAYGITPTVMAGGTTTSISRITDGNLDTNSYYSGVAGRNEYVQIDLGAVYSDIDYLQIWHYYQDGRTYNGTKVEVSEDGAIWKALFDSAISGTYPETASGLTVLVNQGRAVSNAQNTANNALIQGSVVRNPTFSDWQGTFPNYFGAWTSSTVTKETVTTRTGSAMRFSVTSDTQQVGAQITSGFFIPNLPNNKYYAVELDFMLTSGAITGACVLLDWNGMNPYRDSVNLSEIVPSPELNKWYTIRAVMQRPTDTLTGYTGMSGYLLANYTGSTTNKIKNIIFDRLVFREPTAEEIAAYEVTKIVNGRVEVDGGRLTANSVKAESIDARRLSVKDTNGTQTLLVDDNGKVTVNGVVYINSSTMFAEGYNPSDSSGGRNLLLNSRFSTADYANWANWNSPSERFVEDITDLPGFDKALKITTTSTNQGVTQNVSVIQGKKYTISTYVKSAGGQAVLQVYDGSGYPSVVMSSTDAGTNKWVKLSKVFTANAATVNVQIGRGGGGSNGTYWFTGVQIEEGEKTTGWSAAPEDVDGLLNAVVAPNGQIQARDIASSIAVTPEAIKFISEEIDLKGKVTFSDFAVDWAYDDTGNMITNFDQPDYDPANPLYMDTSGYYRAIEEGNDFIANLFTRDDETGKTLINGNYIKTGTIQAKNADFMDVEVFNSDGEVSFSIDSNGNLSTVGTSKSAGYEPGKYGWKIDANGSAEFNSATFRGDIELGYYDSTLDQFVSTGGVQSGTNGLGRDIRFWAGSSMEDAPFKVYSDGSLYATQGTFTGTFSGVVQVGNIIIEDSPDVVGDASITITDDSLIEKVVLSEKQVMIDTITTFGNFLTVDIDNEKLSFGDSTFQIDYANNLIQMKDYSIQGSESLDFTSTTSSGSDDFVFQNTNGDTRVHIEGTMSVRDDIEIPGVLVMRKSTDSGNKGIDYVFI